MGRTRVFWLGVAFCLAVLLGAGAWYRARLHRTPAQYAAAFQEVVADYLAGKRSLDQSAERLATLQYQSLRYGNWEGTGQSTAEITAFAPPGTDSSDPRIGALMQRWQEVARDMMARKLAR